MFADGRTTRARRRPSAWLAWVAAALAVALSGCAAPRLMPRPPEIAARAGSLTAKEAANLEVFERAWSLVDRKFYDGKFGGIDWDAAALRYSGKAMAAATTDELYAILNAMLVELKDAHSSAVTAGERAVEVDKPKARIGVAFLRVDRRWLVREVVPGSPAEKAGVQRGWFLVAHDGQPAGETVDFGLEAGRVHTFDFLDRADQPRSLTIIPELIAINGWREVRALADGVVYLRFDGFDRTSRRWLSDQLKAHRDAPAVVIDLRQNNGGDTFSLGITVGEFFPKRVNWGRLIYRNGRDHEPDSLVWGSARYAGRVAVLIGSTTASSAEIFAHVLQHHQRAVLVGRKTAGVVIGSLRYRLPDGGRLQVGVLDYRGLNDQRIEGVGVRPDIPVAETFADLEAFRAGRDADVAAALAALKAHIGSPLAADLQE